MKDRQEQIMYHLDLLERHKENYNLVTGYFADQGFSNPNITSTNSAIDVAVAVLDVPKKDLIN